jgi:hypothetical protein
MGHVISEKISTTVMTTAHLTKRVRKAKKKGSNGSYLSHTCVPRNVKSLYFSSVYTSGLYSNVLPYFQQYKVEIIGPGKVGKF